MLIRKIHFTSRNQVFSQFLFGLAQTPWLAALARYPTNHGPDWLREAIARQKRKHKRLGYAMAPQRKLRSVYRSGLTRLIEKVGRAGIGDYLEFGVHSCTTLLCMYRELEAMGLKHVRLFGFDSFAGLPVSYVADDVGTWAPGAYKSDYEFAEQILKDEKVNPARVFLTAGFFSETLTPDFPSRHSLSKVSAIMIDCDQYLGASEALTFSRPLIKDHALVLFDDWNSQNLAARNLGQKRAFDEFLATGEFTAEPMKTYTDNAQVFFVSRRG
jgi:O-methyltransferase